MTPHHQPATVLIVEDDPVNRRILRSIIERMHCRPIEAENGLEALTSASVLQPDLILLDIMMEGLDGYQVCKRLKNGPETRTIPVIFISALKEEEDEAHGLSLGAVDYIFKPFSPTIIQARINTHLELKRHRDSLEEIVTERTQELQNALSKIKTLKGLLPICASCKKIRDSGGTWNRLENYIEHRSEAEFSHGICPDCARRLNPEIYDDIMARKKEKD